MSEINLKGLGRFEDDPATFTVRRYHLPAPGDVPHWYQTCACFGFENYSGFWMEIRDPNGIAEKRFRTALISDLGAREFETSFERFTGNGHWASPQALFDSELSHRAGRGKTPSYGTVEDGNATVGQPIVAAMARRVRIAPGKTFQFSLKHVSSKRKNAKLARLSETYLLGA